MRKGRSGRSTDDKVERLLVYQADVLCAVKRIWGLISEEKGMPIEEEKIECLAPYMGASRGVDRYWSNSRTQRG